MPDARGNWVVRSGRCGDQEADGAAETGDGALHDGPSGAGHDGADSVLRGLRFLAHRPGEGLQSRLSEPMRLDSRGFGGTRAADGRSRRPVDACGVEGRSHAQVLPVRGGAGGEEAGGRADLAVPLWCMPGDDDGRRGRDALSMPSLCRHGELGRGDCRRRAGRGEMPGVLAHIPGTCQGTLFWLLGLSVLQGPVPVGGRPGGRDVRPVGAELRGDEALDHAGGMV